MAEVTSTELRKNTRSLLHRIQSGESVTITVDGRAVAVLRPVGQRPTWVARDELVRRLGDQPTLALRQSCTGSRPGRPTTSRSRDAPAGTI